MGVRGRGRVGSGGGQAFCLGKVFDLSTEGPLRALSPIIVSLFLDSTSLDSHGAHSQNI